MLQTDNSIRGKVMRELIARVASDNLIGRKLKSGELRKKMTEPEWRVPEFYNLRVIEEKNCRLELLECDLKNERLVLLQLHGGGYIGGMRNAKAKRLRLQQGTYGSDICLRASHKLLLPAEISCRGACDMGYYSRLLRQTVLIIFSGGLFCEGCFI